MKPEPLKPILRQDMVPHGVLKNSPGLCVLKDVTLTPTFIPFISDCAFLDQETKIRPSPQCCWQLRRQDEGMKTQSLLRADGAKQVFLGRPGLKKQVCTIES